MKKIALLIALILCLVSITACAGNLGEISNDDTKPPIENSNEMSSSEAEKDDTDFNTAENTEIPVENGMQRIEYTIESAVFNFNWGEINSVDNIELTIDIPEHMLKEEDIPNCKTYLRYDKNSADYLRGFVFDGTFEVDPDYVMDESIHNKTDISGIGDAYTSGFEVTNGKTTAGYEYILYEKSNEDNDEYFSYVYIRISDSYIISLNYSDELVNYDYLQKSINSINICK